MSKLVQSDSSDDEILYSINSDISDIDDDDTEEDDGTSESWSGRLLKSTLSYYNGELKLSLDFESKVSRNPSLIEYFMLYFTPKLASYIVDHSNLYRIQTNKIKQSPMTETDLYCLLGFLFYISVAPLPT